MKVKIRPVGTSKGIVIPTLILKQCHAKEEFEMKLQGFDIILHPIKAKPRDGWNEHIRKAINEDGKDALLIDPGQEAQENWEW